MAGTPETAGQRARRLMGEIEASNKGTYSKGDVKLILNQFSSMDAPPQADICETCRAPAEVGDLRRGDVFIHKLVGGKVRPWIVLSCDGRVVRAVAMSSGDKVPDCVQAKCRLWPGAWITSTLATVSVEFASAEVTRPYTNLRHLAEVESAILSAYQSQTVSQSQVSSMAEIVRRVRGDEAKPRQAKEAAA